MLKRSLAIWLVCAMIALSACSSEKTPVAGNNAQSTQNPPEQSTESAELAKQLEISFLSSNFQNAKEGDWIQQQLEAKFNIKLKDRKVNNNDKTQVDLMLASGEMPDAAWLGGDPNAMYDQGTTRTIPRALIEKYAPHYANMLNSSPLGWKVNQLADNPDEYTALTGLFDLNSIFFVPMYRLDWLEKLGIEPNGALKQLDDEGRVWIVDQPFTQEQHTDILKRFTEEDPDGNGKKDTYGMSGLSTDGEDNYAWSSVMGMFGIGYSGEHNSNLEENGKTVQFYVSEKYKDFLSYMSNLYKLGAIDPEFATLDWNKFQEKLGSGKIGYWNTEYNYFNQVFTDRAPMNVLANVPEAKVLVAPPERGAGGEAGTNRYGWNPFSYTFYIANHVDDEKLIRILQMFDFMSFDPEAQIWSRFGQEGIHFTWGGEPGKSTVVPTSQAGEVDSYRGHYVRLAGTWVYELPKIAGEINNYVSGPWAEEYGIYPYRVDPLKQTKYSELVNEYGAGIQTIRKEFFFKAISGQTDVNAGWDNYVKLLKNAGLDKLTEELQHMPLISDFTKK